MMDKKKGNTYSSEIHNHIKSISIYFSAQRTAASTDFVELSIKHKYMG